MDIMNTLKQKVGGVPMWVWVLLGIGATTLFISHRKKTAKATPETAGSAASGQANTNLGTASQLANMFTSAGLMPYQGGNTYVNTAAPAVVEPGQPQAPVTVNVGHMQTVGNLVEELNKKGYPGFTWADFWALNPDIVGKWGLQHATNNDWVFTGWSTPVVVYKPDVKEGLTVSKDNPQAPPQLG